TIVGNLLLMILIKINPHLHTPMYFFLFNMSLIDLCYSSVIIPKMLMNFVSEKNIISYSGCMAQLYFFCVFVNSESLLLSAMAYDQYVAICYPLLYNIKMSSQICSFLVSGVFVMGFAVALAHTGCMLRLSFCSMNQRKVSSVFYTIVIPMLSPIIYSLRNKDVKLAMQKTLRPRMIS
uniref:G-protein coupled receptors family 1 profile domain-containing protein n=1 Tax=Monodelphis domestica TaxID=13616 RepID=F6U285_MONDO